MVVVQLPTVLIAGIGDSITAAPQNGAIQGGPWFSVAVAALQSAFPAYFFVGDNVSQSGTLKSQHWTVQVPMTVGNTPAKTLLKFATWFAWSPNDGNTGAVIQSDYDTYEAAFISTCSSNGFIPVLCTNIPWSALALADDNVRKSVNATVRGLASSSIVVADFDAAMSDGASPARIIAANTADGEHPYTPAGQAAMAPVLSNAIGAYLTAHGY